VGHLFFVASLQNRHRAPPWLTAICARRSGLGAWSASPFIVFFLFVPSCPLWLKGFLISIPAMLRDFGDHLRSPDFRTLVP
jgi:hypothetical protein